MIHYCFKMAQLFLVLITVCALFLEHVLGFTDKANEVIVGRQMDTETAIKISDLLQRNLDQDFSWDDPELSKLLSRCEGDSCNGAGLLDGTPFGKKVPENGALLTFPQCIGCAAGASTEGWTIYKFTLSFFMKTQMLPLSQLKDSCVFYSQRTSIGMTPAGLSKDATKWACSKGFKTIWMMWPYNTESEDGNFWVMFDNDRDGHKNWLYNVWAANEDFLVFHNFDNFQKFSGPINTFFSYMSWAMAASCSGTVYIMTDDPHNLPRGGIWPLIEFPALQTQAERGLVTRAIAVPFNSADFFYETTNNQLLWRTVDLSAGAKAFPRDLRDLNQLNWTSYLDENGNPPSDTQKSFKERTESMFHDRMRNIHHKHDAERRGLEERDACMGGQPYEKPGHDYFGYGQ